VRSGILLPASQFRRLSRAIRTPVRTIFVGHFTSVGTVGMRIERPGKRPRIRAENNTRHFAA
jgi:hypothetical protein